MYKKFFNTDKMTQPLSVLTGVTAGLTEAFVVVSFELVKIRLQDKSNAGKYKNTIDAVQKIYAEEGALAFFKGLEATLWRHGVWNGVRFRSLKCFFFTECKNGCSFYSCWLMFRVGILWLHSLHPLHPPPC